LHAAAAAAAAATVFKRRIGVKRLFTLNAPFRVFSEIISKNPGAIQNFEKLVNTCIRNGFVREAKLILEIT
jgi:hypothetical protein